MCLYVRTTNKNHGLRFATRDIESFKIMMFPLISPIQKFLYGYNRLYSTPIRMSFETQDDFETCDEMEHRIRCVISEYNMIAMHRKYINENNTLRMIISGFHSYADITDAESDMIYKKNAYHNIVKCIIPKHSWYYVGDYKGYTSYVSDHIIIDRTVLEH